MIPEPEPLDPAPASRRIARRTLALGLATVLVLTAGAWVAANELGYFPASEAEPTLSPSPTAVAEVTPAPSPSPEPASPEPLVSDDPLDEVLFDEPLGGAGGRNVVKVENRRDDNLEVKASIQLNRISARKAEPVNFARAYSSCVGCKTIAVALQINLIDNEARQVSPWNMAVALNERCSRCVTVALAYQLSISVDDPKDTPKDVRDLVKEMDRELRAISNDQSIDVLQAATRLDAVIARYETLKADLIKQHDTAEEETSPDVSSAPTEPPPTADPTADPSGEPAEPAPSTSDSPTVTETPHPAPTPSP